MFKYPWGINEEKTEEVRQKIEESSPVVFDIDSSRQEEAIRSLTNLLDNIKSVEDPQDSDKRKEALEALKINSKIINAMYALIRVQNSGPIPSIGRT